MNYLPPLRNHQQMVRVVKEKGNMNAVTAQSFKLGNAFGDHQTSHFDSLFGNGGISPTEQQIRTLDAMNVTSSSLRRPSQTSNGGLLPTRTESSLFHKLNPSTREYMSGMSGGLTMSRSDAAPGTKLRTQLSPNADSKTIYPNRNTIPHAMRKRSDHREPISYASDQHAIPSHHIVADKQQPHNSTIHSNNKDINS